VFARWIDAFAALASRHVQTLVQNPPQLAASSNSNVNSPAPTSRSESGGISRSLGEPGGAMIPIAFCARAL